LPEAFNTLVKPAKTLLYSPADVSSNRKVWIDEWLRAVGE
jgi:thiamine transport system substrate-binding protein